MTQGKLELKVGMFVIGGLILLGLLLLSFAKSSNPFTPTYDLKLRTGNVGGLVNGAKVLMSGVKIGRVDSAELEGDGKSVIVTLEIESKYKIHGDAEFHIQQAGFLGDQYVGIKPAANQKPPLKDGDEVKAEEAFNFQEAARSAMTLIQRLDRAVQQVNTALERVDNSLLSEQSLNSLTNAFANLSRITESTRDTVAKFGTLSDKAHATMDSIHTLVDTNSASIGRSVQNVEQFTKDIRTVTNVTKFTEKLDAAAEELRLLVATNRIGISASVKNIEDSTAALKAVMSDVQAGKGMVGGLLKDDALRAQTDVLMNNLTTLTSNLNRFGLLYKPKQVKTNSTSRSSTYPGRRPYGDR